MKKITSLFLILVSAVSVFIINGCSTASSGGGAGSGNYSYQGAGSKWTASFTSGTFVIEHYTNATDSTAATTVNGDYVDYATGFRKLTVTSASGAGAPTAGTEAYGFEVPGFAFFLKPIGSDSEPIVMVQSGSCPTTNFDANWIVAKRDNASLDDTSDTFGSATFTLDGGSPNASITQLSAVTANNLGTQAVPLTTACSSGLLTLSPGGGETVDMFFTTNNGALVHSYGPGHDSIIFAAPKHTAAVTQAEMAGTYSVLVFDDTRVTDKLFPAQLTIPSAGNITGAEMTNIETGTTAGAITFSNFTPNGLSSGLFTMSIDPTGDNGRLSCTYFVYNGYKTISCNGYGDNVTKNLFFVLGRAI